MPFPYAIGAAEAAIWQGPPPDTLRYAASAHTRPGIAGVAFHQIWAATPFQVTLESWFPPNELLGLSALVVAEDALVNWQVAIQGAVAAVTYGNVNWTQRAGYKLFVNEIIPVGCRMVPRLTGFGVDYQPGAELVTRWTLTPQP